MLRIYLAATMAAGLAIALEYRPGPVEAVGMTVTAPVLLPAAIAWELGVAAFER